MNWALLILAVVLTGRLAVDAARPAPEAMMPRPADVAPLPTPPHLEAPPAKHFAEMVARPLFSPGRRPVGGPAAQGSDRPPQARLVGIVLSGSVRLALVESGGSAPRRLAEGQNLEGWLVAAIEPGRVVLRRDQFEYALSLVKPKRLARPLVH